MGAAPDSLAEGGGGVNGADTHAVRMAAPELRVRAPDPPASSRWPAGAQATDFAELRGVARAVPLIPGMERDDRSLPRGLALLHMSAGALTIDPMPTRGAVLAFAALARSVGSRCPAWLQPWPGLLVETQGDDDAPLIAVTLTRVGDVVIAQETPPAPDGLSIDLVLAYYLHLVDEHVRACRIAARRPARFAELTPAENAEVAEAFEEVDRLLHGAGDRDLTALLA